MNEVQESMGNLQEMLISCRINPQEEIQEPPVAILIRSEEGQVPSFTLGNFSMVIGKAKSKKTFLVGVLAASAVKGGEVIGLAQGKLPVNKRKVLYFDTEQSKFHTTKSIKRIADLTGIGNPENLAAYGLRKYDPDVRLKLIETAIYNDDNVGLVIIDGGRDLLSMGINDEKSATEVTSKFLRWTEERELHIIVVLHQNKNDLNARGHFGTECVNKAETTVSVTEYMHDRSISIIHCEYCRDVPFDDFAFMISDQGLPIATDLPSGSAATRRIATVPNEADESFHKQVISQIFEKDNQLTYGLLQRKIQEVRKIGETRAKQHIKFYIDQGWITKKDKFYTIGS